MSDPEVPPKKEEEEKEGEKETEKAEEAQNGRSDGQEADEAEAETVALTIGESNSEKQADPPTYTSDGPPAYKSTDIRGVIKRAKEESSGKIDFGRRVCVAIFCGVACCGLSIAFFFAIPIAMIVVGALYLKQCDRQHYIPIYLLVGGCFGVVKGIINLAEQLRNKKKGTSLDEKVKETRRPNPLDGIISCFLFAWFIAGCYWVYSIHGDYQSDHPEAEKYCHQVVYLFSFWLLTVSFILAAIALLCCCGICIAMCVIGGTQASYDIS